MRRLGTFVALGLVAGVSAAQSSPQPNIPATVIFHFERRGLSVPIYTITLHEDGSGTYVATRTPPASNSADAAAVQAANIEVSQAISVSSATTAKVFEEIHNSGHLAHCDTKLKNVADTGTKGLDYSGPDGHAGCTYNYTENKPVMAVTDIFIGIQEMLEFGERLEHEHRFDRLGLDAEMQKLVVEIKEKRAIEPGVIGAELRSIAEDGQVIERVRVQAAKLLAMR